MTPPRTFQEALQRIGTPLATELSSAELSQIDADILEAALFSARTNNEWYLERLSEELRSILDGKLDLATARLRLKEALAAIDYEPDPELAGSLQDLSSDRRLNLILETNIQMAQGYGYWRQGQTAAVLDQWPAQELFRAIQPEDPDAKRPWEARFALAGQASGQPSGWTVRNGRMVALKNHRLWEMLGSRRLFEDALGNPYPPFAFNSGMDVRDVSRGDTEAIGIIAPTQSVEPAERPFALAA